MNQELTALRWEFHDFGDGWRITLQIEAIERVKTAQLACQAGEGQGPPDDIGGIGQWNDIRADAARPLRSGPRVSEVPADALARARAVWEPGKVRLSSAARRLRELRAQLDDVPFDEPRLSAAQRVAAFVVESPTWARPVVESSRLELRYWVGTVEGGKLVLLGEQEAPGVVGPIAWFGPFELSAEQMVADHPDRFVYGQVSYRALPLPTRRLLDRRGQERLRFQMLIILPPTARRPRSAKEVMVPVATLERGARTRHCRRRSRWLTRRAATTWPSPAARLCWPASTLACERCSSCAAGRARARCR